VIVILLVIGIIGSLLKTPSEQASTQKVETETVNAVNNEDTDISTTSKSSVEVEEEKCNPNWQCSIWSTCSSLGTQTRTCTDQNKCSISEGKPIIKQSCTPPVVEPEPITLSGNGQEASDIFNLQEGLSVFELKNTGSGHFGIWLMDNMGNKEELLVNTIGPFDGSKAARIDKSGEYILDVSAEGGWTVNIEQPRPTTASEKTSFSGRDQQYAGPFHLDSGLKKFELKNTGSGHFGVWLLDKEGNYVELLVNDIGPFDGSKAVGVYREGIYYFDISAEGNWEINIK